MSRSTPSLRLLSFVLALGFIAPASGQDDGSHWNGSLTPISASSGSMTAMQSEIDDLRRRLDVIEWSEQPPYDGLAYHSFVPAWVVSVDYLNWDLRQRGTDFAITTDDQADAVGRGAVHNLDMDRNSGVRMNLGYRTRSGWEWGIGYTYFHTAGAASAVAPGSGCVWGRKASGI